MVGTEARLGQVLANVLVNAVQAIAHGDEAGHEITVVTSTHGRDVVVEIHDTGTGIAPEIEAKLFEPYVTTKEHGTGLGLSIARTIVEADGGSIVARRGAPRGTIVITLRRAD